MTNCALVLMRRDAGVVTLTLNRPDVLNALTVALVADLRAALESAASDASVGCVVLTGAGRGFSVGADLREGAIFPASSAEEYGQEHWADGIRAATECSRLLHQMPKPTIAMVRGVAAGAGLGLAAACDLRIAAPTAVFSTSFVKVGLSDDFGVTYFLTRLVGTAKARELMYLSEKIDAAEALRIGLVNRVVYEHQIEATVAALAAQIGNGPRVANRYIKRNLNASEAGSLEHLFEVQAEHIARTIKTEDHQEALRAFLEKRAPQFKGH